MAVIITTTNKISCYSVLEYKGMVCANQVVGANIIADISASLTDFVGGNSGAYRNILDDLFSDVRKRMISKTELLGANAILGIRFSFNEISGKNKSMLMVSGYGTAALIEPDNIERMDKLHKLKTFYSEGLLTEVQYEEEKKKLSDLYENFMSDCEAEYDIDMPNVNGVVSNKSNEGEEIDGLGNLWKLSVDGIIEAEVPFKLKGNSNEEVLKNLLKDELYNEAGKFYMQYSHANASEAYEYIFSLCMK